MYGQSDIDTERSKLVKQSKEEVVQTILELQRKRKREYLVSDADIHAMENSRKIRKRTKNYKWGGTRKCQHC